MDVWAWSMIKEIQKKNNNFLIKFGLSENDFCCCYVGFFRSPLLIILQSVMFCRPGLSYLFAKLIFHTNILPVPHLLLALFAWKCLPATIWNFSFISIWVRFNMLIFSFNLPGMVNRFQCEFKKFIKTVRC